MQPWSGAPPVSAGGGRLLCIGDVHGCAAELELMLRHLDADLSDRLVFLGDYVDRGPQSRECVRILLEMKRQLPDTILLRGNHEEMFLDHLDGAGGYGDAFLSNGGAQTMRSFDLRGPLGRKASESAAEEAVDEEIGFLRRELVLHFSEGGVSFVHAGVRPGTALAEQSIDDLLWIREEFTRADPGLPTLVLFGHTPYREPLFDVPRKIGLDTGCVFGGYLSCLDLSAGRLHQVRRGERRVRTTDVSRRMAGLGA